MGVSTNASNSNLQLSGNGTGKVEIMDGITGSFDITQTGSTTITGQADIDYVRIKDNKITTNTSNSVLEISANGTGTVDVQNAMTTLGQTVTGNVAITGRADVDNLRIDANSITAQNSNGGITLNPNGTGTVTINGSFVGITNTLSANKVETDQIAIEGNEITTANSNANLQLGANGTGSIELMSNTVSRTGDIIFDASADIILDAAGKDIIFRYNGTQFGLFTASGTDLLIQSGTTTMLTGNGANAIFNGNITVPGSSTLDGVTITDNTITANASNADLQIGTAGTGVIDILTATQATVGSAGGASALPGQPTGYIKVKIGGTMRVIPFYDES